MNEEKRKYLFWLKILVTIAALTLAVIYFPYIVGFFAKCFQILMPFLAGGIIAFILNIPMKAIEEALFKNAKKKFLLKLKRPVSIVLTLIFVVILVAILLLAVIPQVVETAMTLPAQFTIFYKNTVRNVEKFMVQHPEIANQALAELEKFKDIRIDWEKVITSVKDFFMNGVGGSFVKNTFTMAGKIGGGIFNTVVAAIFSIYILAQKENLGKQFKRLAAAVLPEKPFYFVMKVTYLLSDNFSKFIAGQCVEAVILGLMTMIAMLIFRFDYVVLVGVLVAFTALIPLVGGFIGCGIGAFLFLMQDPIKALWFILLWFVVQQIEGNLIYPHVVGNSVGLPSMWVLAAITVGGSLMGIGGMLFFIPLTSTVYTLVRDYTNERNAKKEWTKEALKKQSFTFVSDEEQKRRRGGIFSNLVGKFVKKDKKDGGKKGQGNGAGKKEDLIKESRSEKAMETEGKKDSDRSISQDIKNEGEAREGAVSDNGGMKAGGDKEGNDIEKVNSAAPKNGKDSARPGGNNQNKGGGQNRNRKKRK